MSGARTYTRVYHSLTTSPGIVTASVRSGSTARRPQRIHTPVVIAPPRRIVRCAWTLFPVAGVGTLTTLPLGFAPMEIFQVLLKIFCLKLYMSLVMRKPAFCICKNKDADQLRGDREADQHLCLRYIESTIPLLPMYEISCL